MGKNTKCGAEKVCGRRHKHLFWRVLIGLAFLGAAGIVVCSALGIVAWDINIGWIALVAFLGALALACLLELQWFGVFLPLAGIATILNVQTDYLPQINDQIGTVWIVAVLLAIGFSILIRKKSWGHTFVWKGGDLSEEVNWHDNVIDGEDDENVEVSVRLGSTIKYVNTDNFKYARLVNKLGGMKVYFNNANIKGKSAKIELNGNLCGYELYIPRSWRIVNNLDMTMGGMEEKIPRAFSGKNEKTVTLVGSLTMSGVEIIYV